MTKDITIPLKLVEAADQLAQDLGISASELYVAALSAYIAQYQPNDITAALDQVYSSEESALDPVLLQLQTDSLNDQEDW
jgi:hypothetical protein